MSHDAAYTPCIRPENARFDALASRQVVKSTSAGVWEVRVLAQCSSARCCPRRTPPHGTAPCRGHVRVESCAEHGRLAVRY